MLLALGQQEIAEPVNIQIRAAIGCSMHKTLRVGGIRINQRGAQHESRVGLKVAQGADLHFTMGHRMFEGQLLGMQADSRRWRSPIKGVTENWKSFGRGMDSDLVGAAGHWLSLHQRPSFGGCHDSEARFRPLPTSMQRSIQISVSRPDQRGIDRKL